VLAKKVLAKKVLAKKVLAKKVLAKKVLAKKVPAKKVLGVPGNPLNRTKDRNLRRAAMVLVRVERVGKETKMPRANHPVPKVLQVQVSIGAERPLGLVERRVAEGRRLSKDLRKRTWNTRRRRPTWYSTTSIVNAINPIPSCSGAWGGRQTT
jgi:hypothetical protein